MFVRYQLPIPAGLHFGILLKNAQKLADYFKNHQEVVNVIHPSQFLGLDKERADKYMHSGYGPLLGIELKGGERAGRKLIDNLKMIYHVANIGDVRTLAIHPASTTHSQLNETEQLAAGVTPGYVRFSVGIEHIDDIIADIEQALGS